MQLQSVVQLAVTAQLISAFVFATPRIVLNHQNFCDCTGRFVSGLVGNPACCFSDAKAQINNDFNVVKLYVFYYHCVSEIDIVASGMQTKVSKCL